MVQVSYPQVVDTYPRPMVCYPCYLPPRRGIGTYPRVVDTYPRAVAPYPRAVAPYPRAVAPYPRAVATYPRSMAPYPRSVATYPRSEATYPRSVATYPRSVATYPPALATYPRAVATYPRAVATYPRSVVIGRIAECVAESGGRLLVREGRTQPGHVHCRFSKSGSEGTEFKWRHRGREKYRKEMRAKGRT
jgi:hypothetical protein